MLICPSTQGDLPAATNQPAADRAAVNPPLPAKSRSRQIFMYVKKK
jgi:hypothetical protein